jgi:hypothetical protein
MMPKPTKLPSQYEKFAPKMKIRQKRVQIRKSKSEIESLGRNFDGILTKNIAISVTEID